MKFRKMKKKGSLEDLIYIGSGLLVIGVVALLMFKLMDLSNDTIQNNDVFDAYSKDVGNTGENFFPTVIDNGVLFLAIGLCLVSITLAAMVRVHPIFIWIYLLSTVLLIIFCAAFSNVYQGLAADAAFTALADRLTFTTYILSYLPFIVGIFSGLLAIVMYKGWQNAQ